MDLFYLEFNDKLERIDSQSKDIQHFCFEVYEWIKKDLQISKIADFIQNC
jgi:hypothetical protein